jgi:hypothetical protein
MTGTHYIRVFWLHSSPEEPVELFSELDEQRFEVRKVEVWADGRTGHAGQHTEVGGTRLGELPVPSLSEIAADPQFEPHEISAADFEKRWRESAL